MTYEQDILAQHSSSRLRRAVLDNPPQPEVPWHEYPVPTHYTLIEGEAWRHWTLEDRPLSKYIVSLKYSDGSEWDRSNGWRDGVISPTPPPKPLHWTTETSNHRR